MPPNKDPPVFWIFAGPNGSGKSTAYSAGRLEDEISRIWIVNPDLLTATIREAEGHDLAAANLAAVTRMEAWLDATLSVHRSVGVEPYSRPKSTGGWSRRRDLSASASV